MNKTKKILFSVVSSMLIAANVASLGSCGLFGGSGGNSDVEAIAYDGSEVTVTFYHTMGANLKDVLNKYIPEFNELYPNITIDHQTMGDYDGLREQISTELLGGNSPSLAYCYPDHVALYNKGKSVITLDNFINSDLVVERADGTTETVGYTQAQLNDFVDSYYEEGRAYGDNKMYTLPYVKSTEVLYYNKDYFTENELPLPTDDMTWDDMENLCASIQAIEEAKGNKNCIPLGYDSEANWFITMCEQYGSAYTSTEKGNHFLFDNETNRTFVQELMSWYDKRYVITEEIYGGYTSALFTETGKNEDGSDKQRSYMTIGSSAGASYQNPDKQEGEGISYPFEVGIAQIPQIDPENPTMISQGPSLCLFKKSNEQEMAAAWLFAKFLTTNVELQANFSMRSGYASVLESVETNPVYANFLATADGNANLQASCVKQSIKQKEYCYVSPAFYGSSDARVQVGLLLQNCFVNAPKDKAQWASFVEQQFEDAIEELAYDYGY